MLSSEPVKRGRGRPKGSKRSKRLLQAPRAELIPVLEERIERQADGCWTYQRPPARNGYAVFYYDKHVQGFAHRVAYEIWVGPIPPDTYVQQRCHNKLCCNPAHLYLAPFDAIIEKRSAAGRSIAGLRNPKVKLQIEQVREIRRRALAGEVIKDLAVEFGVSPPTVSQIKNGNTWKEADAAAA